MKTKIIIPLISLLALVAIHIIAAPLGTTFNYQGRLNDGTNPANGSYDFKFTLYDADTGGGIVAGPITTNNAVPVNNGLFTVSLDFGSVFNGDARWLDIGVRTNGNTEPHTNLSPRIKLNPVPYATYAATANSAAVATNAATATIASTVAANGVANTSLQTGAVTSDKVEDGTLTAADINSATFATTFWKVDGNVGSTPGTHFLGTTDNQPFELKVNGQRALRLEPNASGPNVVGGSANNTLAAGVYAATIAGGIYNDIGANSPHSAISGGYDNDIGTNSVRSTIGGGYNNNIADNSSSATIAGGHNNDIGVNGPDSAIGGGAYNKISTNSADATIAGGLYNDIGTNSSNSTIGGGKNNTIANNAMYATIPGGQLNAATNYAFAAGRRAKANHTGSFVWGDSTDADVASTANNQFLIRASGGVGIGTTNPAAALDVAGTIQAGTLLVTNFAVVTNLNADLLDGQSASDFWNLDGNAGSTPGTHFLGTTDNQPFELKVNGQRALRLEPNASGPNVVGGSANNTLAAGVYAATIAGGIYNDIGTNSSYSAISGGWNNNIAPNSSSATIAGGHDNDIGVNGPDSAIGGGAYNKISTNSADATIAGGLYNDIGTNSSRSAIGGGYDNNIANNAEYATIPGGRLNVATNYAFAAGRRAKANHTGSFVWGDSTDADVASTANNQFLIRASGGVGIGTTNPTAALEVASTSKNAVFGRTTSGPGVMGLTTDWTEAGVHGEHRSGSATNHGYLAGGDYGVKSEGKLEVVGDALVSDQLRVSGSILNYGNLTNNNDMEVGGTARLKGETQVTGDLVFSNTAAVRGSHGPNGGAPFPRAAYDSGWVDVPLDGERTLNHNIGGDAYDYFVDLTFRNEAPGRSGIHNSGIGGDDFGGENDSGAFYTMLNSTSVKLVRGIDATQTPWMRIRIWVIR